MLNTAARVGRAEELAVQCRRMILVMASLRADEGDSSQLTARGFQTALGRAGLVAGADQVASIIEDLHGDSMLAPNPRTSLPRPDYVRWRITGEGERELAAVAESMEQSLQWIAEHTAQVLNRRRSDAPSQLDPEDLARRTDTYERGGVPRPHSAADLDWRDVRSVTVCHAQKPEADDDDDLATVCITGDALDAWWASLSSESKAACLVSFYEGEAMASKRVTITPEGSAALNAQEGA